MSITLSDKQVLTSLRSLVEENREKVYKSPGDSALGICYYVHQDVEGKKSAGCIVGHLLNRLGIPLEDLEEAETNGAQAAMSIVGVTGVSYPVQTLLRNIQRHQDTGKPWGEAFDLARKENPYGDPYAESKA
ncbi:hypothetical protein [Streptomyces sp. NPDC057363]|uniref:hypothetical protein n=1 Tax=Streptomyces sp. NPDC057363 TaxID=3346107 RepID=UPI003638AA9C